MTHPIFPHICLEAIVKYTYSCPKSLQAEGGVLAINTGNHPCRLLRITQVFQNVYVTPQKLRFPPTSAWKHRSKLSIPEAPPAASGVLDVSSAGDLQ